MNMQLSTWRDGARGERGVRRRHRRRAAHLATAVGQGATCTMPSLNLLPTIQQAITNLLTVYEPEFLRFGYTPVPRVRDHPDLLGTASG